MVCSVCFGLVNGAKVHANKSSCELALAIGSSKCLDCGGTMPCNNKDCLSRTHSLAAIWSLVRERPKWRTVEEARKAYGILDARYSGEPLKIREKEVWVPAHLASRGSEDSLFVVKGIRVATIVSEQRALSELMGEGSYVKATKEWDKAFGLLFVEDITFGDEKSSESGQQASEVEALRRELEETRKRLEESQRTGSSTIPSIGEIRSADKEVASLLRKGNPMDGALDAILRTDAKAFSNTMDATPPVVKGNFPVGELSSLMFKVKDYVREGKEKSTVVEYGADGVLRHVKKRKRVKVDSFSTWMEASLHILEVMEGSDRAMAQDYRAYMRRITALVEAKYSWAKIYEYDKEYRKARKKVEARWNTDFPMLFEVFLRPEVFKGNEKAAAKDKGVKRKAGYCFKFNDTGKCDTGDQCKFDHCCRWCSKWNHASKDCYSRKEKRVPGPPNSKQK